MWCLQLEGAGQDSGQDLPVGAEQFCCASLGFLLHIIIPYYYYKANLSFIYLYLILVNYRIK